MSALASPIGVWAQVMLDITWQLAGLVVLVLLCERMLRLRHPRVRHALWWFVLLAPLLLAPVRLWLAAGPAQVQVTVPAPAVAVFNLGSREPATAPPSEGLGTPAFWGSPKLAVRRNLPAALATLWAAGCLLLALRLAVGHGRARRMLFEGEPVTAAHVLETLSGLCAQAGIRRRVELRTSRAVDSAVLYGALRPVILLPQEWPLRLYPEHLRAMLAHEVAHVRRGDVLSQLVQRALEAILFFHPGQWLAGRRIALAREELCDAWALQHGVTRHEYARTLAVAVEHAQARLAVAAVGLAESRGTLLRRMEAIVKGDRMGSTSRLALAMLGTVVLVAAAMFATVQVRAASTGGGGGGRQETVMQGGGGGGGAGAPAQAASGGGGGYDAMLMRITVADLDRKQVRTYRVGKRVSDYPDREDLSTPELTYATVNRAIARGDQEIWSRISAKGSYTESGGGSGTPPAQVDPGEAARRLAAEIAEVWIYQGKWGGVIAHMSGERPEGTYNVRSLELKQGRWMNRGESFTPTIQQARDRFALGVLGPQLRQRLESEATTKAMKRPAQFTEMAQKLFQGIRAAGYAAFLGSEPDAWEEFPADYMVYTDYPSWVKWVCTTFSKNPIVEVKLGTVFRNAEGRPTVPYRLTLRDGRVLAGDLPFYVDVTPEKPAWQAGTGLDWHLQKGSQPQ